MAGISTQARNGGRAGPGAGPDRRAARRKPASAGAAPAPPRQRPYDQALRRGFDVLCAAPPTSDRLASLGVTLTAHTIRLPVMNRELHIDLDQRGVRVDETRLARSAWAVLAVHYLCAAHLTPDPRPVSFSCFQDCRSYLSVFGKRIIERFPATSGRSAQQFAQRGEQCGGTRVAGSGIGYRFDLFPRVPITLVRYEGDDEVSPGASVIYRADVERLLPAEDRVVAVELLLDHLSGKPMSEIGGPPC